MCLFFLNVLPVSFDMFVLIFWHCLVCENPSSKLFLAIKQSCLQCCVDLTACSMSSQGLFQFKLSTVKTEVRIALPTFYDTNK